MYVAPHQLFTFYGLEVLRALDENVDVSIVSMAANCLHRSVRRVWKVWIKVSKVFNSPSVGSIVSVICCRGSLWSRRARRAWWAWWGNIASEGSSNNLSHGGFDFVFCQRF